MTLQAEKKAEAKKEEKPKEEKPKEEKKKEEKPAADVRNFDTQSKYVSIN